MLAAAIGRKDPFHLTVTQLTPCSRARAPPYTRHNGQTWQGAVSASSAMARAGPRVVWLGLSSDPYDLK